MQDQANLGNAEPATQAVRPRPLRRWAWRLGRVLLLVYVGLLAVLYILQTRLIFPGASSKGRPEAQFQPPPGSELLNLETPAGEKVVALFGHALGPDGEPHPNPSSCPTILYCYGNGMCLADVIPEFERFRQLGAHVIVPEYLGYGLSGGEPSEAGCYAAADAAYDHLWSRVEVDKSRLVAAGWSMGAAVATDLAWRRPVAGLALFCSFTRMADMAQRQFPFVPARLLLRHKFDNLAKVKKISCPILIMQGTDDTLIPLAMADRLEQAAAGEVTRLDISGADHNEFFAVGAGKIFPAFEQFLTRLSRLP